MCEVTGRKVRVELMREFSTRAPHRLVYLAAFVQPPTGRQHYAPCYGPSGHRVAIGQSPILATDQPGEGAFQLTRRTLSAKPRCDRRDQIVRTNPELVQQSLVHRYAQNRVDVRLRGFWRVKPGGDAVDRAQFLGGERRPPLGLEDRQTCVKRL